MESTLVLITPNYKYELKDSEQNIARLNKYLKDTFKDTSKVLFEFTVDGTEYSIPIASYGGHFCPQGSGCNCHCHDEERGYNDKLMRTSVDRETHKPDMYDDTIVKPKHEGNYMKKTTIRNISSFSDEKDDFLE